MSLPLEDKIMEEIGLGNYFYWYNGSSSCRAICLTAIEKLEKNVAIHANQGDHINHLNKRLLFQLRRIAEYGDSSDYELTKTWQACADVIRTLMELNMITNEKEYALKIDESIRYLNDYIHRKKSDIYLEWD